MSTRIVGPALRRRLLHPATIGLVAGLAVIGLWRLTSGIAATTDAESESTVPTVLLEPTEEVSLDGGWTRVDLPGRSRLNNVWEIGDTLFAAGWDSSARRTVVWRSPDGGVWRQVSVESEEFDKSAVYDMVGFNGLVVAVGARQIDEHPVFDQVAVPAVWTSADGVAFERLDSIDVELFVPAGVDPSSFGAGGFTSILALEDRLLIGGWEGDADALSGRGQTRPGLWLTFDTRAFSRLGDALATGPDTTGVVRALTTDGASLVAAGTQDDAATVWTSADGTEWSPAMSDRSIGSVAVAATPTVGGALVLGQGVVGEGESLGDARLLWSPGVEGYVEVQAAGLDDGVVADLGAGSVGVVAAGSVPLGESGVTAALWWSADGANFESVQIDPLARASDLRAVVVGERAIVAVGEVHDQPSVWVRSLDQAEEVTVGVGSLFLPPAWATVFQQQEANGAVPSTVLRAGDQLYGISPARWLWRSEDGDVWSLDAFDAVGLEDAEVISQIVFSEIGWMAAGSGDGTSLWFSIDGLRWGRPTLSPPCCTVALFRDAPGFTALVFDVATETWLTAGTADGLVWEWDDASVDLPVSSIDHVASVGRLGLLWGRPVDTVDTLFGSIDGSFWFPIRGPDDAFATVEWRRVWDLGAEVVASGTIAGEPVLYRSLDGVEWLPLSLPALGAESLVVQDVGGFGGGLAVLVSFDDRPNRLLTFTGVGVQEEIPLDATSGFSGLWSILVPNDQSLRMAGPDHGRMTIWEWIAQP